MRLKQTKIQFNKSCIQRTVVANFVDTFLFADFFIRMSFLNSETKDFENIVGSCQS